MSDATVLRETDVDGVRTYWVATGRPTLRASLGFRYGSADEPVPEAGWQHLVEHLCLADNPGHAGLDVNGSVDLHETTFDAAGEPAAVVSHLERLARWLSAPRLDRIDHEREILRLEARVRGVGHVAEALLQRYGARGPGTSALPGPGLGRASVELLAERIARVFTAENAVLALDGPPPPDLRLPLPTGRPHPLAAALPLQDGPVAYLSALDVVGSGVVRRDGAMFVAHTVVQRALHERLRTEEAAAYAPWTSYLPVDSENALVAFGSDLHPDRSLEAAAMVQDLLAALAEDGPPEPWVTETVERATRSMADPYAAAGVAFGAAHAHLHGRPVDDLANALRRVRQITADDVRTDLAAIHDSLHLGGPPDVVQNALLPVLEFATSPPADSPVTARSINWPADRSSLRVHRSRVEVADGEVARAVAFADVAGYLVHQDGTRHLLRHDGYGLTIDPDDWRGGANTVEVIDRLVPPELHLPQPSLGRTPPPRLGPYRRWWRATRRTAGSVGIILLLAAILAPLLFAARIAIDPQRPGRAVAWSVLTALAVSAVTRWRLKRDS